MRCAVIDIGSKSVRLLLWADGRSIYKLVETTRLGEGLAGAGVLSAAAMERTADAVASFCARARADGAERVAAFATAAARRAANGRDFVCLVRGRCGLDVDVVSGEEEARLALEGALGGRDGGVVDVGGASTEITVAEGGTVVYARSVDIGAVRLKDLCGEDAAALSSVIERSVAQFTDVPPCALRAVGGTATCLAALEKEVEPYDPAAIEGTVLTAARIGEWGMRLLSMPQSERLRLRGMDARRADILGGAALLLRAAVLRAGADRVTVSDRDNLEGYVLRLCGEAEK